MAKVLRCECGYLVTGSTDEEFIENARAHMRDAHPDMVDKIAVADILSMAQEV
jgi:predicted small metal-binding protein